MIKVMNKEQTQAISIEVCGVPWEWRLRLGKLGKRTPTKGKNKGIEQTGILYGRETYHGTLKDALKEAHRRITAEFGLVEEQQVIEGIEGWNRAIAEEEKLVQLTAAAHQAVVDFLKVQGERFKTLAAKEDDDEEDGTDQGGVPGIS